LHYVEEVAMRPVFLLSLLALLPAAPASAVQSVVDNGATVTVTEAAYRVTWGVVGSRYWRGNPQPTSQGTTLFGMWDDGSPGSNTPPNYPDPQGRVLRRGVVRNSAWSVPGDISRREDTRYNTTSGRRPRSPASGSPTARAPRPTTTPTS
jgi:hypothetical protein